MSEPSVRDPLGAAALTPEALANLALFPLPDLVFFPGTLLPLHIFEPRYRQMTADVLAQPERLLAVARLRPGWEADYHGTPPVHDIAGVGEVIHQERLEDGRYNLLLYGLGRVRLIAPTQQAPYRRVRAELLADRYPPATDLGVATTAALALAGRLAERAPELGRVLREIGPLGEPARVADLLGSVLARHPDDRQALLSTIDVGERLSRVTELAAAMVARLSPSAGSPN